MVSNILMNTSNNTNPGKNILTILTVLGWMVQFIVSVRNGDPKVVGYIASGFWTGFTLGRVALADITHYFGERRMVFVYLTLAVTMQLLFWLVPNIIVIAIAVFMLGRLSGSGYLMGRSADRSMYRIRHRTILPYWALCSYTGGAGGPSNWGFR